MAEAQTEDQGTQAPLVEPGTFEFDDGYLLLDPAVVDAKVRRKSLSASTMNSLVGRSVCTASYAAGKVLPRKEDPFGVAETGTMAHAVLEYFYALPPAERTYAAAMPLLEKVLDTTISDEKFGDAAQATRDLVRPKVLAGFETIFDIETPSEVDVFGLESPVKWGTKIEGIPVAGFIDRVDNLDGGALRVVDYKSGKVKSPGYYGDPHGDQIRFYKAVKEAELGVEVSEGKLYYTAHAKSRNVNLDAKHMKKTVGKMKKAWDTHEEMVEEAEFRLEPSPLCGWCPLVSICPAAQASGKEAKVPQPTPVQLGMEIPVRASLSEPDSPADDRQSTEEKGESVATKKRRKWSEEKPWKAEIGGRLQPASYSATAVMGLATRALSDMAKHNAAVADDQKVKIDQPSVMALASTYAYAIKESQEELSAGIDWQAGLNTRLRSALFTSTEFHGIPFGANLAAWDEWVDRVISNMVMLVEIGEAIYDGSDEEGDRDPWENLASDSAGAGREARSQHDSTEVEAPAEESPDEVEASFDD